MKKRIVFLEREKEVNILLLDNDKYNEDNDKKQFKYLLTENSNENTHDLSEKIVPKTKPESKTLLITNLQRPFVNNALYDKLNKDKKISKFWLDFIKTHCYVQVINYLHSIIVLKMP